MRKDMTLPDADEMRAAVRLLLRSLGEDPDRPGLKTTPARFVTALFEMTVGNTVPDPSKILTVFEEDIDTHDEMVCVRGVEFTSLCEHHLMPFSGVAHVAYVPAQLPYCADTDDPKQRPLVRIVGLSKLARLVECFAKRLQVQERMTADIANTLQAAVKPLGAACVVEAVHSCMACRGVRKRATMVTSRLTGVFRTDPTVRAELFSLIGGGK